jgi:hypothetical protein
MSLEIKGVFIPPDQQTASFSNKKMGACHDEGHVNAIPCLPMGTDESGKWKGITP